MPLIRKERNACSRNCYLVSSTKYSMKVKRVGLVVTSFSATLHSRVDIVIDWSQETETSREMLRELFAAVVRSPRDTLLRCGV